MLGPGVLVPVQGNQSTSRLAKGGEEGEDETLNPSEMLVNVMYRRMKP
jgi:hypothetical protein